jgi:hypothetical protein
MACGGTFSILADYDDWAQLFLSGVGDSDGARAHVAEVIDCENPAPL